MIGRTVEDVTEFGRVELYEPAPEPGYQARATGEFVDAANMIRNSDGSPVCLPPGKAVWLAPMNDPSFQWKITQAEC